MTNKRAWGSFDTSRRRFLRRTVAGLGVVLIGFDGATARTQQDGARPRTLAVFQPPNLPENIAIDQQGNHYVSMFSTGEIWWVPTVEDAPPRSVASVPLGGDDEGENVLGIAPTADGQALLACVNSLDATTHGVWRISRGDDGESEQVASMEPGTSVLNGITDDPLPDGSFLVTDHARGAIWRVSETEDTEVWLEDPRLDPNPYADVPVGADGIALGPNGDVWVDNLSFGSILRVPVESDGSAGTPEVFVRDDALVGSDGLTADENGNLYVAVNARNAIVRVTPDGQIETVVSGGNLDFPADVHFGRTERTRTTLFFVNFALPSAQSEDREANPSYMSIDVGGPGATATTVTTTTT